MKASKKPAAIHQWVKDPTQACQGQARERAARAAEAEAIPVRIPFPAAGARKETGRHLVYEMGGSRGVITAKVQNVGEVCDEIDALLDEIERDEEVRMISIYTLNGLFASLPIR
jgi:hypothetical protein